jgi:hypothetical protein
MDTAIGNSMVLEYADRSMVSSTDARIRKTFEGGNARFRA